MGETCRCGPVLWASEKDWERVRRMTDRLARRQTKWLRKRTIGPNIFETWGNRRDA